MPAIKERIIALAARAIMSDEDVRAQLEQDHVEAKDLAERICKAKQTQQRKNLLVQLKTKLTAHSRAEEKVVYDALLTLKRRDQAQQIANEGYVEHAIVDQLLADLEVADASTNEWKAKAKVLKELLAHHIDEEQTETFSELGATFSSEDLEQMGIRFNKEKSKLLRTLDGKSKNKPERRSQPASRGNGQRRVNASA